MDSNIGNTYINRRAFIAGAAAVGAGLSALSVASEVKASEASSSADAPSTGCRSWEVKPDPIPDSDIVEEIDADIVVVGAGVAGCCSAQSAAEEGASVVVFEKTEKAQGRGLDIGSIGNQYQKDHPEISQYIDATRAEKIFYSFSHSNVNRLLFRHWAKNSGRAFDHLANYLKETYDMEVAQTSSAASDRWDTEDDDFLSLPTNQSFGTEWFDEDGNWLMASIVTKIAKWAQDLGADFRFETPAEQLVTDDFGAVTGVIAKSANGYIKANAKYGVILATGDIGGSEEMLREWCPLALRAQGNMYYPVGANTGDGIRMGMWIGADIQHGFAAPMIHALGAGGPLAQGGDGLGFICVNRNGERYTCEANNVPGMANALLNQPGGIGYTLFDANYRENVLRMAPSNESFAGGAIVDDSTQETIDNAVAAADGRCFKADTIEDLAAQIGADPDTLQATIDRWNELVAQGEDTDMSLPSNLLTPLDTPPYYASLIPQSVMTIIFGLNCDSYSRVCDSNDEPIEGLYAVGNVQGNFFADDYPMVCPGISHGRCLTFGYTLPKAILKGELI